MLELQTEDCVAFELKHVVLIGLDAAEMQQRLQGLRGACGYDGEQAVKLAVAAPELLMLHPDNVKVRKVCFGVKVLSKCPQGAFCSINSQSCGSCGCCAMPRCGHVVKGCFACGCAETQAISNKPQALLRTLKALNSVLQLPTEDCVAFALKHVVLIGLDAAGMQQRVQGLRGACGYDGEQAVKLAVAAPELLMLHPDNIKVRKMRTLVVLG
jgi:sRNA-binding carbon storage regulator CsrA